MLHKCRTRWVQKLHLHCLALVNSKTYVVLKLMLTGTHDHTYRLQTLSFQILMHVLMLLMCLSMSGMFHK
jgi:thiol:disulfide interchange protein